MKRIKLFAVAAALAALTAAPTLASQGPAASAGTAGPFLQWLGFALFIGYCTLAVVSSQWDDGTYGDF